MVTRARHVVSEEYYDKYQAARILDITSYELDSLTRVRHIAHEVVQNEAPGSYFNVPYIDGMAEKLKLAVSHGGPERDYVLMRLWHYYCLYEGGNRFEKGDAARRLQYKTEVIRRLNDYIEQGVGVTRVNDLYESLAHLFRPATIVGWSYGGRIATVRIGGVHYTSQSYFDAFVRLMTKGKKISELAPELGIVEPTLRTRTRGKGIAAYEAPDGALRILPETADFLRKQYGVADAEEYVSLSDFAKELHIKLAVAQLAVRNNRIATVRHKGPVKFEVRRDELERWKLAFTTLNPDFAWLAQGLGDPWLVPTLGAHKVCWQLGLANSTVNSWGGSGLLPFYVRGFNDADGPQFRLYVRQYIVGLIMFGLDTARTVDIELAREYRYLCVSKDRIVDDD